MKQIHLLQLPPEVVSLLESLDKKVEDLTTELKELKDLMAISEASFMQLEQKVKTIEEHIIEINQAAHDYDVAVTKHINDVNDNYVKAIAEVQTSATTLIEEVREAANTSIAQAKEEAQTSVTKLTERLAAMEKIHLGLAKKELTMGVNDEVMANMQLPLIYTDDFGCTITWKSDRPKYISDTGKITMPTHEEGHQGVLLTATLTYGGSTDTKVFSYEIPPLPEPEPPVEETPQS